MILLTTQEPRVLTRIMYLTGDQHNAAVHTAARLFANIYTDGRFVYSRGWNGRISRCFSRDINKVD